jgi:hypothetical protein
MKDANGFVLGMQVRVSDGTPQPPARFTKKLSDWKLHNFDGVLVERDVQHNRYTVEQPPSRGWSLTAALVIHRSGIRPGSISEIPGAPMIQLKNRGMANTVDVAALFGLQAA